MKQSKLESMLETAVSTAVGFGVSWVTWVSVAGPFFGIPTPFVQSFGIVCIFTVTSLLRGYVVRRFFNAQLHQAVHRMAKVFAGWRA